MARVFLLRLKDGAQIALIRPMFSKRALVGQSLIAGALLALPARAEQPASTQTASPSDAPQADKRGPARRLSPPKRFDLKKLKGRLRSVTSPEQPSTPKQERGDVERKLASARARALFGGRQIPSAYYKELKRYALRVAKGERISAVAARAGDKATMERANRFLKREKKRHAQWIDQFVRGQKKLHAPGSGESNK